MNGDPARSPHANGVGPYDVATGAVVEGPATEVLNVYEVRESEGNVQIGA